VTLRLRPSTLANIADFLVRFVEMFIYADPIVASATAGAAPYKWRLPPFRSIVFDLGKGVTLFLVPDSEKSKEPNTVSFSFSLFNPFPS